MKPLLEIRNLSVDFENEKQLTRAVKNISFKVERNEVVAIVGESGSGKSVSALSILQLIPSPPARYSSGEIWFSEDGEKSLDLLKTGKKKLQTIRGNKIG